MSLTTIKKRIVAGIEDRTDPAEIAAHVASLSKDGFWPDVDYTDRTYPDWNTAHHLQRVRSMVFCLKKGIAVPGVTETRLREVAFRGLDCWLENDFMNRPWWWNEIGVPLMMSDVLLMLHEDLTSEQLALGLKILERARIGKTGQNRVWLAKITARRAILSGDVSLATRAFGSIEGEIRISESEGIQPDYSFHQHGDCLYNHGYGKVFAVDCCATAALLRGTDFAFSDDTISLICSYVLDGSQWMCRGRYPDYGASGRQITRAGENTEYLAAAATDLLKLRTGRESELKALVARIENRGAHLNGNRHFYRSDFMTHHRDSFYASARAYSTRTLNTDNAAGCGENQKSHYLGDGCNYLMITGDEYMDIAPVWEWQKIPGSTIEQTPVFPESIQIRGTTSFVGGVSDGHYGMMACDFVRNALNAKKLWAFFDKEYVCLGAGIGCRTDNRTITTLNQCRLSGDVTVCMPDGSVQPLRRGLHRLMGPLTLYHGHTAYVLNEPCELFVGNDSQSGSWSEVSETMSKDTVTTDVFKTWIDHGAWAGNEGYAYTVIPCVEGDPVWIDPIDRGIRILGNSPQLQAVEHSGNGLVMAAFYEPGVLSVREDMSLQVDKSCLLLLRQNEGSMNVLVSSPDSSAGNVNVTILHGTGKTEMNFPLPDPRMQIASVNTT